MTFGFNANTSEESMRGTILHEFGHAIGLKHEHQHPDCPIDWNKVVLYQYYKDNGNWGKDKVDEQILTKFDKNDPNLRFFEYDRDSVMHYWILEEMAIGDFAIPENTQLSELDKKPFWLRFLLDVPGDRCIGMTCGMFD